MRAYLEGKTMSLSNETVDDLLREMQADMSKVREVRCLVCDTFPETPRSFVDRATILGFSPASIRRKLIDRLNIVISDDTLRKHGREHVQRDITNSG